MANKPTKRKMIVLSCLIAFFIVITAAVIFFATRREIENGNENNGGFINNGDISESPPDGEPTPHDVTLAATALGDLEITPLHTSERGITLDTAFLIKSDKKTLSAEHLKKYLSVPGGEGFTLEEHEDKTFLLRFDNLLENHRIYNIVYHPTGYAPLSFAFQTVDIFRITATSPAGNTFDIPNNAGIEITFSQPLAGDFSDAFAIDPPVRGQFHQRGNTYIFAPDEAFLPGIRYTVTVKRGLVSTTGETMEDEYVFHFSTRWGDWHARGFSLQGNIYETFLPWNDVFIAVSVYDYVSYYINDGGKRDFIVNLYELHTPESFIDFRGVHTGTLVGEFLLEVSEVDITEWWSLFYLFLGQPLPEGYYVAEIRMADTNENFAVNKFIQVSALSVFSLSVSGETLFWVHDAATGLPAGGAKVHVGGETVTTNHEGIAIVPTRQENKAPIIIEYGEYLPFAYTKPTFGLPPLLPSDRFLSYIYTDRPVYRPDDTVHVFGVIKPRTGFGHQPTDVFTLHVGNILEIPITLDAFNSFALRIPVTGLFGYMDVDVRVNGERLMSVWLEFFEYTNHAFVLSGGFDRLVYDIGDYASAEISVTSFAGKPIENAALRRGETVLYSDGNGIASGFVTVAEHYDTFTPHWNPYWNSIWFSVVGNAQMSQSIYFPIITVPRDIMMEHTWAGNVLTLNTNKILIDRLEEHHSVLPFWTQIENDTFRGEAVDVDFTVTVSRSVTTRTVRNQRYDHINRRTVTTYNYDTTISHYRTLHGRTVNGYAEIFDLPQSDDPLIHYDITVEYNDSRGRPTLIRVHPVYWLFHTLFDSTIREFHFTMESTRLGVNETVSVSVTEGRLWNPDWTRNDTAPPNEGTMLAVLVRDGILAVETGNPSGVPITFTEECISNAFLFGAYFDGSRIFPINNFAVLYFDHTQRETEIMLSFDRESYRPGDEVTLYIETAADALVLISVVDESALLGRRHSADFLARLYQSSWPTGWNFAQFASFTQHEFGSGISDGAWGGGNGNGYGGEDFRDIFLDSPVFERVQTDYNGKATLTFPLPHQVTSWRVVAIALTPEGYAGDVYENIIATLDFYVDLLLTPEYIVGDDIVAAAVTYGAGNEPVQFTFSILKDGAEIYTQTLTAVNNRTHMVTADNNRTHTLTVDNNRAEFNAGKRETGDYVMRVTAVSGNRRDAVELPFTVTPGGMIIENRINGHLSGGFDPSVYLMRDLPVRVVLSNANTKPLTDILRGINNPNSHRTDYMAAAAFTEYFLTGNADFARVRAAVHAPWTGGIRELVYEEAEFFYTARFAASLPEFTDRHLLKRYVQDQSTDTGFTTAWRRGAELLMRAAVGEPVLLCIYETLSQLHWGEYFAWLYLVAALVTIGDDAGALETFTKMSISPPYPMSDYDRELSGTLRLFINTTLTPQAALEYINRGYTNQYISDVPERVNFVRRAYFTGGTVSEVEYTLDGQTKTVRLENFERYTLIISREQFLALNLTPVSGDTEYDITFYGYGHENWNEEHNQIEITRTVWLTRNGLYRVQLQITLPYGTRGAFTVYDRIPGNKRYVPLRPPWDQWQHTHFFSVRHMQRQLMELHFFACPRISSRYTLFYYVSPLFGGDMAEGTTYITNHDVKNPLWGKTN
jgi:hypothetical protein